MCIIPYNEFLDIEAIIKMLTDRWMDRHRQCITQTNLCKSTKTENELKVVIVILHWKQ